jgi:hypothetical protein
MESQDERFYKQVSFFLDKLKVNNRRYHQTPIIDGRDCLRNMEKYFDRDGERYAFVKGDISIRVTKATKCSEYHDCITSLIIPFGTRVHLGSLWWTTNNYSSKHYYSDELLTPFFERKCRSVFAYVEGSIAHDTISKTPYYPVKVYSKYDHFFQYQNKEIVYPQQDGFSYRQTGNTSCGGGIHFFFDYRDSLKYIKVP